MQDSYTFKLKSNKHKRKTYRHLIWTSDDVSNRPLVMKYMTSKALVLAVILCLLVGGFVGLLVFESKRDLRYEQKLAQKDVEIEELTQKNTDLNFEVASLNNTVKILSETVNTKTANEAELTETLEAQWVPSDFPLTGGASFEEIFEPEPMCVFDAAEGVMVVATAAGYIVDIYEDEEFGNAVVIDHDNGYKTIYKNEGDPMVKIGDSVSQGTTLYLVGDDNDKLGYQVTKDDVLINPLEVLEISG